jgi:signal transduction histidine kinase/ligand-binding sensor domain-containing protein
MSRIVLVLLIVSNSVVGLALDPVLRTSQYAHTSWRVQDGVFNGNPTAIVQTADGYLWIGTSSGLVRFDGLQFVPWQLPEGAALSNGVYSLGASRDGSLWIGSSVLMRWKDGKLSSYPNLDGRINAILEDPAGGVWITRSRTRDGRGPLCHISDEQVRCFGNRDGISISYAGALFRDRSGTLWLGGSGGLATGKPGSFETFVPPALRAASQLGGVGAFADGPDGSMLIGMVQSGSNMGLQEFKADHWNSFMSHAFDGSTLQINNLLRDHSDSLWIGTVSEGLCVVRDGRIDYFRSSDGLSSNVVNAIYEDRENNIWVVTSEGLDRFRVPKVLTFSSREGLSSDYAGSVVATNDGTVWIGNHDALDEIHAGEISSIRAAQGLPGKRVTVMLEDHLERLWVGVDNTLSVREGGKFHRLIRSDGSPVGTLQALIEDRNGDLWGIPAPNTSRLLHIHGFTVQEEEVGPASSRIRSIAADPVGGIRVGFQNGDIAIYRDRVLKVVMSKANSPVLQLHDASDGNLLSLSSGKLVGWQNERPQTLDLQNGLPCDHAFTFIVDKQGTLWLYSSCGLIEIDKTELQRWWKDPKARLACTLFDSFDGVQAAETSFTPRASESPDGKLWFVNGAVAQMIDPKTLSTNGLAPPVRIESLIADRKSYPLQQALRLPPHTHDLEIDYTGLSFVVPQKVQFRYRLEGRDKDWQTPGTRRQAFYTDLRPGQYRFHVIASNNDGVWNLSGATLEFSIAPAFYQTSWFRILLGAAAAALLLLLYSIRMRHVTANIKARLGERLNERERIARELHDTLLQDFQAVILHFQAASKRLEKGDPTRKALEQGLDYADEVLAQGRDRIQDLRADTAVSDQLSDSLARYGNQLAQARNISFSMKVTGAEDKLDPTVRDEIYRIGREALGNAFKHSNGSRVEVETIYDPATVKMRVCDDGVGIDPDMLLHGRPGHWGLSGMRERAEKVGATLSIWSRPAEGTQLELVLPVHSPDQRKSKWLRWWIKPVSNEGDSK